MAEIEDSFEDDQRDVFMIEIRTAMVHLTSDIHLYVQSGNLGDINGISEIYRIIQTKCCLSHWQTYFYLIIFNIFLHFKYIFNIYLFIFIALIAFYS